VVGERQAALTSGQPVSFNHSVDFKGTSKEKIVPQKKNLPIFF
jgi:hypothetical protein